MPLRTIESIPTRPGSKAKAGERGTPPTSGQPVPTYWPGAPAPFPTNATVPFQYPLYKQCDPRWGKDLIYTQTVCQVGCLMSACSMALNGRGYLLNGTVAPNPGSLNTWLKANGGYTQGNDLEENKLELIGKGVVYKGKAFNLTIPYVKSLVQDGMIVIANVMHGHHFVLMVGWDAGETEFYVNDSGFNRVSYPYSDVVGWRLFTMANVKPPQAHLWHT